MRLALLLPLLLFGCHSTPEGRKTLAPGRRPGVRVPSTNLTLYFVRHGETVSNATGRYNAKGLNTLSALGQRQIQDAARRLANVHFDAAIVSPSPRALLTAQPILAEHHMTAEIWPELNECCTEHGRARLLPPARSVKYDGPVRIPKPLAGLFTIPSRNSRMFAYGDYQDGIRQTQMAADRFRQEFGGKPITVLVVGHSAQGSRFLDLLLGRKPVGDIWLRNGSITKLVQTAGGSFRLKP